MTEMTPTLHLRWNRDESVYKDLPTRLEQLWIEVPIPGWKPDNPIREWRPLPVVRVGWDRANYDEPIPDERTF